MMMFFIGTLRQGHGVEPVRAVLPIAPCTFYGHKARKADPGRQPERTKRGAFLRPEIRRVWEDNLQVCGARKVWHQLNREEIEVARCTVERLMREMGLKGTVRGKKLQDRHATFKAMTLLGASGHPDHAKIKLRLQPIAGR